MADWSKPVITSNYVTFVDEVKNRDIDAITLQLNALTNPPTGAIKLLRSPVKFQEWNGTAFVDRILDVTGGGTGVASLGSLGPAMGLGSMAYQNTAGFSIGGGTINNLALTGSLGYTGGVANFSSTTGHVLTIQAPASYYCLIASGSKTAPSYGVAVQAGMGASTEYAFIVQNANANANGFIVRGDLCCIVPTGLVIPVGTDKWVNA